MLINGARYDVEDGGRAFDDRGDDDQVPLVGVQADGRIPGPVERAVGSREAGRFVREIEDEVAVEERAGADLVVAYE